MLIFSFVLSPNNPVLRTDEVHFKIPVPIMTGHDVNALFDFMAESIAKVFFCARVVRPPHKRNTSC